MSHIETNSNLLLRDADAACHCLACDLEHWGVGIVDPVSQRSPADEDSDLDIFELSAEGRPHGSQAAIPRDKVDVEGVSLCVEAEFSGRRTGSEELGHAPLLAPGQ